MTGDLRGRALINDSLGSALRSGDHALGKIPELLKTVLADETWREFVTKRGEHVQHERFADFVTAKPLRGLGSDVALVQRIVADDKETLDLLDQALQNPAGNPGSVNNINGRPKGTSEAQALRRLRKDAPELHAEVLAGNLSAHAAMVRAGLRRRTGTVRYDDPESAARTLRKHMPAETRRALARLLMDD